MKKQSLAYLQRKHKFSEKPLGFFSTALKLHYTLYTKIIFIFLNKIFTIWLGGVAEKVTTSPICCIDFRDMKLGQKVPWHGNILKMLDLGIRLPIFCWRQHFSPKIAETYRNLAMVIVFNYCSNLNINRRIDNSGRNHFLSLVHIRR